MPQATDYYDPADDYEPPPQGYCEECGKWTALKETDCGLGPLEAWGYKFVDKNIQWLTPCCTAHLSEQNYQWWLCKHSGDNEFECLLGHTDCESFEGGKECPDFEMQDN